MPGLTPLRQKARSAVPRYGVAAVYVAMALAPGLLLQQHGFRGVELPLFLFAIALASWNGGTGPAVLSMLLSIFCFVFFFAPPLHSFRFTITDLPALLILMGFAVLITRFSATRRRVEGELRQARDALEKRSIELNSSNKELEAFAYSVSHDLRAPLRHMVGFAELLRKKASSALDEKGRGYLTNIQEAATRMGILIDDLLAFSRIGRVETQKTRVNLEQLAREVVNEIRQDTTGRDIDWKIDPLPNCYGDRSMLRLVLVNLLSNAAKFTRGRQGASIEIGCSDENNHEVEIFVRDNGVGFDMKYVDKLFGVFQRLHSSDTFEGTGIGLATVQRIIHRHGGKVRAQGAVGQGASFFFTVPKA